VHRQTETLPQRHNQIVGRQIGLVREAALEIIDDLQAELVSAPRTRLLR
jgi:hypothetical protein